MRLSKNSSFYPLKLSTQASNQEGLTTDLQLSDLTMQLDDAIGLPLTTQLVLDPSVRQAGSTCDREQCVRVALESHPEIAEARAKVEQASAAVRLAKRQYIPDLEADEMPLLKNTRHSSPSQKRTSLVLKKRSSCAYKRPTTSWNAPAR